jgi:hypothetical protein
MIDPDLLAALEPVLALFRELRVRHYVCGSIASSAHGIARASVDADVVAELRPSHVGRIATALSGSYYVPDRLVREAVERRGSFNLIHLETMLKVDVFVAKDRPFDLRALERATRRQSAAVDVPGLPLASAEDVVLAKLEWYRRGNETSDRQWSDVIGVLSASGPALDRPYLEEGARELGVSDLLERALDEAALRE